LTIFRLRLIFNHSTDSTARFYPKLLFFLSKNINFRRTSDGAHLIRTSAEEWMDKIALWLHESVPQPLQMNKPKDKTKVWGKNVLLSPLND
jgi:hypothetical protein